MIMIQMIKIPNLFPILDLTIIESDEVVNTPIVEKKRFLFLVLRNGRLYSCAFLKKEISLWKMNTFFNKFQIH